MAKKGARKTVRRAAKRTTRHKAVHHKAVHNGPVAHRIYEPEPRKMNLAKFGQWIFLTGVLIAVLAGSISGLYTQVIWVLALLGLIVGLINFALRDEIPFLIAVLILLASSSSLSLILNSIPMIGTKLTTVVTYLIVFVVPAGFVVAMKSIFTFARE